MTISLALYLLRQESQRKEISGNYVWPKLIISSSCKRKKQNNDKAGDSIEVLVVIPNLGKQIHQKHLQKTLKTYSKISNRIAKST